MCDMIPFIEFEDIKIHFWSEIQWIWGIEVELSDVNHCLGACRGNSEGKY